MLLHKEILNPTFEGLYPIHCFKSIAVENNTIRIFFKGGKVEVSYYPGDMIKIFIGETCEKSYNTLAINNNLQTIPVKVQEENDSIKIIGSTIDTLINKGTLKISFVSKDGKIVNKDHKPCSKSKDIFFISKTNDCIAYYGFGEKSGSLNKKGYYLENYNTDDPSNDDNTTLMYKTIPFYIGVRQHNALDQSYYGIYVDNSFRSYFDMGKAQQEMVSFGANGGQIQYYFIPGMDMKEVVNKYGLLTGYMDMPPLWSLGYQQCRYSYASRGEVEVLTNTFREKGIPCDCIYLDIHYMEKYKVMTFDENIFPKPVEMLSTLEEKGFKVVTILDPGVKVEDGYDTYTKGLEGDHFVKKADGDTYIGEVWAGPSAFPDFSNSAARSWWKEELKPFLSLGVRGLWNDMNEPAAFDNVFKTMPEDNIHNSDHGFIEHKEFHNLYGMEMSRCSKEAQEEFRENERPFSMTRATFAGGQKYSSIWTGDNQSTWDHLRMSIPMNCNLGISGFSFIGNDVGGFGGECTEELFIRWMQLGTFLPIFRNHSAIFTRRQEPWAFGTRAESIAVKAINLRYNFLPYLYNMYYKSYSEGIPVFRPMIMEFPKDMNVVDMYTEFMFGDNILIAPVLHEGEREKSIYLPAGNWYNYFTKEKYVGGTYYCIEVALEDIAVFVKEGSIIPVYKEHINFIGEKHVEITLEIFKGQGKLTYYEDDGISLDYKKGKFNIYEIESLNTETQNTTIKLIHNGLGTESQFKLKYL